MLITHTMLTSARPEKIWDIWTDVQNWSSWNSTLRKAQLKGQKFEENASGVMVDERGRKAPFKIISCDPKFSYTLIAKYPFARLNIRRFIGYDHGKTMFTHEISMSGILSWFWWPLLKRKLQPALQGIMQNVKDMAEVEVETVPLAMAI